MAALTTQRRLPRLDRAGWLGALGMAVVVAVVGWVRHRNGWSGALDLGIFDQGVWLLSRGLAPEVTVNGRNLFADHLSPVLVLFVPLYRLTATPVWLIAGQAAALGAGLPAIRRFAAVHGVDTRPVTVVWLVSAPLLAAAVFDFHPSTLAVAPLAWLICSLDDDRRWPSLVAASAVLLCRADLGWIVASLAVVAPTRKRRDLVLVGLGGAAMGWIVPSLLGAEGTFPIHYGSLGETPAEALTHPWRVFTAFHAADVAIYLFWMTAGGIVAVGAPRWACTVLVAGLPVLLSEWAGTESPEFHYGAPFVPLVLAGSIVALGSGKAWARPRYLVIGGLAASLLVGPLSPAASGAYSFWRVISPRVGDELDEALSAVGPDEPVAASNRVLVHLTHREQAYGFPIPFEDTNLSVLYGGEDSEAAARIDIVVVEDDAVNRADLHDIGFEVEDLGRLLIGRRR